jgi:hypothetical protein
MTLRLGCSFATSTVNETFFQKNAKKRRTRSSIPGKEKLCVDRVFSGITVRLGHGCGSAFDLLSPPWIGLDRRGVLQKERKWLT